MSAARDDQVEGGIAEHRTPADALHQPLDCIAALPGANPGESVAKGVVAGYDPSGDNSDPGI
jgi:hypothetical protein